MKYYLIVGIVLFGLVAWVFVTRTSDPTIVSTRGLHWHAALTIEVGTTTIAIPEGIGLLPTEHLPVHTHDTTGEIHMEFSGVVRHADLTLSHVFDEWGTPIDSFGANMTMTVNGATSTAYDSYEMRDGDKIVLHYE